MLRRLISIFAVCMSPTLNGSFALQHFEHGNAVELHNKIMFNFYPGLPHNYIVIKGRVVFVRYNPLPRQHIRMLLISLFYSDVA